FATVTSPGRLQLIGVEPSVLVDAAHNPAGAKTLAAALGTYFGFEEIVFVFGTLADKDAAGILEALAPVATRFHVTRSHSDRAMDQETLGDLVLATTGSESTFVYTELADALEAAREWARDGERRAVVVTGSITVVGEAMAIAEDENWKSAPND
ncbi:MAG: cyanophycin synthetase, partial [Leifsonia sp.]